MRVGLIASPFIPVPPVRYGGTELFIANLAEALVRAGVDVTVYTNGESTVNADIRWRYRRQDWPLASETSGLLKELDHVSWAIALASAECDVIHLNSTVAVPFSRFTSKPVICTLHHPREQALTDNYERYDGVTYVAISRHQAGVHPTLPTTVIHHGIDVERYAFSDEKQPYLCFLGRICPVKGAHHAIEIAKRAGLQLKIAGEVQPIFQNYFDEVIRPNIDGRQIEFLGEADHELKNNLLKHATAFLFPIEWDEPFGLAMVEAMACGTPVIAFEGGAVKEIVKNGTSGYVCRNVDEAVAALGRESLCPRTVRAYAEANFSSDVMAKHYLELYRRQVDDPETVDDKPEVMEAR
ncbi:MAG TPA: glycosyltransferase family 4 protein [Acidobacteriaceae bacterium]|jgi:glycosyltransferase involved in cell wall biosynthesis|nr:glycosyltransferase family 4 protein [Acidobacteriaceae bacterium]